MKLRRMEMSPNINITCILSLVLFFSISTSIHANNAELIREIRKTCDGVSSLVANGTRAKIDVRDGYEVEIKADNSVSIKKNGILVERIKHYTAADRQRCIDSLTRVLKNSHESVKPIAKLGIMYGTFAFPENLEALTVLQKNDGKRVFIDTINMDVQPGFDENNNIISECYDEGINNRVFGGDISENTIAIPLPVSFYQSNEKEIYFEPETYAGYACEYVIQFRLDDTRPLPLSAGGTGIVNIPIRKTFLVTETRIGYRTVFQLREE